MFETLFIVTVIVAIFGFVYLAHEKDQEKNRADNLQRRMTETSEDDRRKAEELINQEMKKQRRLKQRAESKAKKATESPANVVTPPNSATPDQK